MKKHVVTLTDIYIEEHARLLKAQQNYGDVFVHALGVYTLIEKFFVEYNGSADVCSDLFIRFFISARNSYLLTLFSLMRLHQPQASFDLRQFMEAGVNAAYALGNPNYEDFATTDEFGVLHPTEKLRGKRNDWIDKNYSKMSEDLKKIKGPVQFSTHSNLVDTYRTVKNIYDKSGKQKVKTSFFDIEDKWLVNAGLWQLANTGLGVLGLIYEVNRDYKKIKIVPDFEQIHGGFMTANINIKNSVMKTKRFKKSDGIVKKKEEVLENLGVK